MAVYGYIRVSSDKQTVENQRFEIENWCKSNNLKIDHWIEETISGTKNYEKRKLGSLLELASKGDVIICSEISRLGRSLYMIMEILSICMEKGITIMTVKDKFILNNDLTSKVLAFAFSLCAEIERQLISQRTKEALARKKAEGVILGRPKGSRNRHTKLSDYEEFVEYDIVFRNMSYSAVARKYGVDRSTVVRFCRSHDIYKPPKWTVKYTESIKNMYGNFDEVMDEREIEIRNSKTDEE